VLGPLEPESPSSDLPAKPVNRAPQEKPCPPPTPSAPRPAAAAANCTQGDCAFPAAWWRRNQTEYKALGNANGAGLLKIAVSDYFPEGPTLYVVPGAWCDTSGALANASTSGLRPRASRRRFLRFLMADEAKAWQPPSVTVNGGMTCTILGEDAVSYKVGGGAAQAAERVNNGAYKIPLPNNMADVSVATLRRGCWWKGCRRGSDRPLLGWLPRLCCAAACSMTVRQRLDAWLVPERWLMAPGS
jgi:hypothetical protein